MADKLRIYNNAITLCGGELLAGLTTEGKSRRLCDQHYPDVLQETLEAGAWKFAMRTVALTADSAVDTGFGYANAFTMPEDWCRTYAVSANMFLDPPLVAFSNEGGFLFADCDPLYLRFVSDDPAYGGDLGLWPRLFTSYFEGLLAERICPGLTESEQKLDRVTAQRKAAERKAKVHDAFREGPKFPPTGRFVSARGATNHRDPQGR